MSTFHDAFLDTRRRIEAGEDPDAVVPALLALAQAAEEISMAEGLYGDGEDAEDEA
jgi:hypothetical protein